MSQTASIIVEPFSANAQAQYIDLKADIWLVFIIQKDEPMAASANHFVSDPIDIANSIIRLADSQAVICSITVSRI